MTFITLNIIYQPTKMKNEIKDGVVIIYLEGNLLGVQATPVVMGMVMQNIQEGNKRVVFNLGGVNYVDSAGLGMLLSAASKIKNAGGMLALSNLPEQVKKLLRTTKVESVFRIQADETAAIEQLKAQA